MTRQRRRERASSQTIRCDAPESQLLSADDEALVLPYPHQVIGPFESAPQWMEVENSVTGARLVAKALPGALLESTLEGLSRVAGLSHPSTATLDAVLSESGELVLLRELVDGVTLAERLRGRPGVDVGWALRSVCHVLGALSEAHNAGVTHGSLDLRHVLVQPPYGDFTKVIGFEASIVRAPPTAEQRAADLHAVARVLSRCLDATRARTPAADEPGDLLYELGIRIGEGSTLEGLVAQGLSLDPSERFVSAEAFLDAVEGVLEAIVAPDRDGSFPCPVHRGPATPLLWVFPGDPSVQAMLSSILEAAGDEFDVRILHRAQHESTLEGLRSGRERVPALVVFGDAHAHDPPNLLSCLRVSAEIRYVLVTSSTPTAYGLAGALREVGLHRWVTAADRPGAVGVIREQLAQGAPAREHYDRLRLRHQELRDQTGGMLRNLSTRRSLLAPRPGK